MTFLLKSMWRNVLRGNPIMKSTLRSQKLSSSISEVTHGKSPDMIMASLKSCVTCSDVLATVQTQLPVLTHKHLLQALRTLFNIQRAGNVDVDVDTLIHDPAFNVLCQNFNKHARALEINEVIEAIKTLTYLNVPEDTLIMQTMLQLVRCNINILNCRQIMFLDFLLFKFNSKNHLVDALKLALPLAFQIQMPLELDNEDLPLLRDMLSYCTRHSLPDRCINNVVTGLLLHDQVIDAQAARSIIWSLCEVNCTEEVYPTRVQLLHICCDILTQNLDQLSYEEVLRTTAKLKRRILEKHPEYYHELLMDAIADYVVKNHVEFEKGLLIARVLSRIAHTHLGLVEHLCHVAAESPTTLSEARTNILLGFINCLSNNNYIPDPDVWSELKRQICSNNVLNGNNATLPWTKVSLELASLGLYIDKLISRVFSKEFLAEYLARENNLLDYLQLLTLQEAVRTFHSEQYGLPEDIIKKAKELYPTSSFATYLEEHIAKGLGGHEYVTKNVLLPNGFVADCVICLKGGHPVKLPTLEHNNNKLSIEDLNLPQGSIVVCLMNFKPGCFSMNSNRLRGTFKLILDILDKHGYAAVPVNTHEWMKAPTHERIPYLMREIGYKCGEMGMKLCAT